MVNRACVRERGIPDVGTPAHKRTLPLMCHRFLELPSAPVQPSPPRAPPQAEFEFEFEGC